MANYLASSAAAELGSLVHLDNGSDASSEDDDFLLEDIDATTEEGRQLLLDRLLALRTETEEAQEMLSKGSIERATRDARSDLIQRDASWDPVALEARVQEQVQQYKQRWAVECEDLENERGMIQAYMNQANGSNGRSAPAGEPDDCSDTASEEEDSFLENIDVTTEEGQEQLFNKLLELESEIEDAQEMLEDEGIDTVTKDVRNELIEENTFCDPQELEARVEEEVQEYKQLWSDECERLEDERSLVQDCLQDLGIPLEKVYQALERLTAELATTAVWKEAARPNCDLSEQAVEDQRCADAKLAESSPIVIVNGQHYRQPVGGVLTQHMGTVVQALADKHQQGCDQRYEASSPAELAELMPDNEEAIAVYDLCNEVHAPAALMLLPAANTLQLDQLTIYQTRDMHRCDESQDIAKETRQNRKALKRVANAKRARSRRANQLESNDIVANPEPIWVDTPPDISVEDNMLSALNGATSSNNGEGRGGDDDPSHKRPKVGSSVENQSPQDKYDGLGGKDSPIVLDP